ncbi:Ankyrin repeat and SOCS box protein 17 [Acipenser ruthenus]|uniref:Ankyrin repeat and SOCS box protein 17 n=1 Tax=Acipenser ruthenus TaxID=7906 RepID=A0A662YXG5_ACIRT|nr:ankyrin repeat and SOCS box protein 17-like [Acipenser ruthenus]RXN00582.1 Ankyrin repeat and SOCS box protein 17 [Acipenser ruthenus]
MSDSADPTASNCVKTNVFCDLVERIGRRPLYQFPGQWGYQSYEPRIYRTLAKLLRNADLDQFEALISDYIGFVQDARQRLDVHFYLEFTEICINTILYWVFARRGNPNFVKKLMEKTSDFLQDKTNNLALIWRPFTPVYSPSPLSGVTPLHYVAQTRQHNILKILLQYGLLEREITPNYIVLTVLFYPPRVRILDDLDFTDIIEDARACVALCARVLTHISITDIETQIGFGRHPLIADWKDCIPPTRYKEPCELVHLCRVTVRNCLLTYNRLPDGIYGLPVPRALHSFLNLDT